MRVLLIAPMSSIHAATVPGLAGKRRMRGGRGEHRSARCRRQSRVPAFSAGSAGAVKRMAPLRIAWRYVQLRALRKRIVPDITHVHWADSRALACRLAGFSPLVLTCWGSDINCYFRPEARRRSLWMIRATLAAVDHIFADSPQLIERCRTLAGRPVPSGRCCTWVSTAAVLPLNHILRRRHAGASELAIPPEASVLLGVRRSRDITATIALLRLLPLPAATVRVRWFCCCTVTLPKRAWKPHCHGKSTKAVLGCGSVARRTVV